MIMDTMFDYIKWRGDERFSMRPFNDVDAMILTYVSYLDIKSVMKDGSRRMLKDICGELKLKDGGYNILTVTGTTGESPLMDELAGSKRFGDIYVRDFIDVFKPSESLQFAALTFDLDDDVSMMTFRGTDDSLAGWKEDFMLSYRMMPGQRMSAEYVTSVISSDAKKGSEKGYYISGHSKGANLALYSAVSIDDSMWDKILHVYMFDGPGLCPDVMPDKDITRIRDRSTHIRPSYSVMGGLFDAELPDTRIVKSTSYDILQHDMISWGIEYGDFLYTDEAEARSNWICEGLKRWIESADLSQREKLVNEMFDAFADNGYSRLKDLSDKGPKSLEQLLITMSGLSPEVKVLVKSLPKQLFHSIKLGRWQP